MLKNLKILLIGTLLVLSSKTYGGEQNIEPQPNSGSEIEINEETNDFVLEESILKIKGDSEYGEYLSGDCTACHQVDGSYNGIPSITGWDEESFVWVMHEYKEKYRTHPVMQMMAGRLANDEIAALAAYFATLE